MAKLSNIVSNLTSCNIKIERAGIRVLGKAALAQYTSHVNCIDTADVTKTQSSRINHAWVKDGDRWKLLGGISYDK